MSFCVVFSILFLSITSNRVYGAENKWAFNNRINVKNSAKSVSIQNTKYNSNGTGRTSMPFTVSTDCFLNLYCSEQLTGFVNGATYDFAITVSNLSSWYNGSTDYSVSSINMACPSNLYVWVQKNGSEWQCLGKYADGASYEFSQVLSSDTSYFSVRLCQSSTNSDDIYTARIAASGTFTPYVWSKSETFYTYATMSVDLKYKLHVDKTVQEEIRDEIKKGNELQKEQNETSKGILGKITEFFASFFENLKGLFVPEDGYFSDFFTRLNDFFSEKLGMLYAPIDMFITFLNTIKDASSNDSGITFPELAWDGTVIIPETKFSFSTITKDFPDLQEKIYFVTDVILVGAVLWLLQIKLKEVLEN